MHAYVSECREEERTGKERKRAHLQLQEDLRGLVHAPGLPERCDQTRVARVAGVLQSGARGGGAHGRGGREIRVGYFWMKNGGRREGRRDGTGVHT